MNTEAIFYLAGVKRRNGVTEYAVDGKGICWTENEARARRFKQLARAVKVADEFADLCDGYGFTKKVTDHI